MKCMSQYIRIMSLKMRWVRIWATFGIQTIPCRRTWSITNGVQRLWQHIVETAYHWLAQRHCVASNLRMWSCVSSSGIQDHDNGDDCMLHWWRSVGIPESIQKFEGGEYSVTGEVFQILWGWLPVYGGFSWARPAIFGEDLLCWFEGKIGLLH